MFKLNKYFLLLSLFILIFFFFFLYNKNKFHQYYFLKNFVFGDNEYKNLLEMNLMISEKTTFNNSDNRDFTINWVFRPEHFHPTYPKISITDINNDGKKELYYASQTKKVYELDAVTGEIIRTWNFPIGQSSSRGTLLYEKNNKYYLLTSSTVSLPIRIYSLDLNKKNIEVDWQANLHGQFVETGINFYEDRFIVATRDAPYSRGSLYIFDIYGKRIFGPDKNVDICNGRPTIEKDFFVHGSHNFYNPKYGNSIIKRDFETGNIIWVKNVGFDTGFVSSSIINFNNDKFSDVAVYDIKNNATKILDGKNGKEINTLPGLLVEEFQDDIILEYKSENINDNNYRNAELISKNYNYFNNDIEQLILYLEKNNLINKFSYFYTVMVTNAYPKMKNIFYKYLLFVNKSSINYLKNKFDIKLNPNIKDELENIDDVIHFFDTKKIYGENYFILTDSKLNYFNFHIFYVYRDILIYFVYDEEGNVINYNITKLNFDSFNNTFLKNFYNGEKIPFPNITISNISDSDNDNKLEVHLSIENYLLSFNLDVIENFDIGISNFPNLENSHDIYYFK